ncbi:MAG: hypothetical protein FWE35_14125 [Streptosporangiales bacterium]|nr:hypothetical protein [Streptosporangiales bacterium]
MPVLLLIVGLLVLAATIRVAMGHGGELSRERADYAPLDLGPVSAADVALLRPPSNGWGYNKEATDEALDRIAESVRERDVRIVALEQLVTDLSRDPEPVALGDPIPGARHRRAVEAPESAVPESAAPEAEARTETETETEADTAEPAGRKSQDEDTDTESPEPAQPAETTLPQPAVPAPAWPATPGLPPVTWPSAPSVADAAAEETTAPQPAVREPDDPEAGAPEAVQPQQGIRVRGGQPERQPRESRNTEPPPERSHG